MEQRILVIDDDLQILKLYLRILTKGGYAVHTESTGQGGIEALENKGPFDLVVLDLSMPQPDGFEILKTLRSNRPGLRILAISGFLGGALLKTSEILGASASLNKSDVPEMLLPTVNNLLRR